jgi:hypothetical protein
MALFILGEIPGHPETIEYEDDKGVLCCSPPKSHLDTVAGLSGWVPEDTR